MFWCGVDNGFSGFIVMLTEQNKIVAVEPYPRNEESKLFDIFEKYKPSYTIMEKPFMAGGFAKVASSDFEILGRYKQTLSYLDLPYDTALARSWRKVLGLQITAANNEKGEPIGKRDLWKFAAIEYARKLFDEEDFEKLCVDWREHENERKGPLIDKHGPDDNMVESALLAVYSRKVWEEQQ
jgi:hypothetical protein